MKLAKEVSSVTLRLVVQQGNDKLATRVARKSAERGMNSRKAHAGTRKAADEGHSDKFCSLGETDNEAPLTRRENNAMSLFVRVAQPCGKDKKYAKQKCGPWYRLVKADRRYW